MMQMRVRHATPGHARRAQQQLVSSLGAALRARWIQTLDCEPTTTADDERAAVECTSGDERRTSRLHGEAGERRRDDAVAT
jgi:hypothetical protein